MQLQFLGRVSLFLFFFSLPALMQPLDPAHCSTASRNQPIPNSTRDKLAESILTTPKKSSKTIQLAMFGLPDDPLQGDRRNTKDLSAISLAQFHTATCRR
ncbi:hypothetical protein [Laspinema palackyanum]|uniref:hypothetical protein n=1 Tax=Laspinema palackyanum TaxID=3231601 RepID=UPI00345D1820|nr:hypothetical protein [Laspinema sp. D2c]